MGLGNSKFKVVNKLEEHDKLVLLLGDSGAGKSKFLDLLCEQQNLPGVSSRVDHALSKAKDGGFCFVRIEFKDQNNREHKIVVMDTKPIVTSSLEIKKYLSSKCLNKRNIQLLGVLLLQDFNVNRVTGDLDTRFPFFGIVNAICGTSDCLQKTNLVLTHFDPIKVQNTQAFQTRYNSYCERFKSMFGESGLGDNRIFKHTNTSQSAQDILQDIVGRGLGLSGTR